jgi:hypothetical protein
MRSWQRKPLLSARNSVSIDYFFHNDLAHLISSPLGDLLLENVKLVEGLSPNEEIDYVVMKGQMGVT